MTSLSKRKFATYVLVIFLAGAGSGALGAWQVSRRVPVAPVPPAEIGARLRARFQSQLALTPDQAQKIDPMIDQAMGRVETIRQETANHVFANVSQLHEQVLTVLTSEQKTRFEVLERERRVRLRQKFGPETNAP
jgi:Spy/CpxP family protein refolding chaperone